MLSPVQVQTSPAMAAALAAITRAFSRPVHVGTARTVLRHGMSLVALQSRYGNRAHMYGRRGIDGAVAALEHQYREEKRVLALHGAISGRVAGLPHMVTRELRLLLRWMRRYDANTFPRTVDALCGRYAEAAE